MSKVDILLSNLNNQQLITILNSKEYWELLKIIAEDIVLNAKNAPNEATIESKFDTELAIIFEKLFNRLGFSYSPIKEDAIETKRALSKGRADTSVGALIIEFKHSSKLKSEKDRSKAIVQASEYLEGFNAKNINKSIALVTDGIVASFLNFNNNTIAIEAFKEIDASVLDRLIRSIISLGQKALNSYNLVKDFCVDIKGTLPLSVQLGRELFKILTTNPSDKTKMLIDEWETLFKLAHDDQSQQVAILNRKKALSDYFNVDLSALEEQYLALFALQTAYAIIVKTTAFKVVSHIRYGKDFLNLEKTINFDENSLKNVYQNLEEGAIFRQYGITNLLEGDFFSWYSADNQWSSNIYMILNSIHKLLSEYDGIEIFRNKNKAQDFFKDLYIKMMPDAVRHSLGEYYTKHWLAEKVIDDCLKEIDISSWRGIDPCCGSGTFITIMIDKVISSFDDNAPKPLILKNVLHRIMGIDLNPVTVLTARVNYFMNIASLITDENNIEIPIYLGDAAYVPNVNEIDGVKCYNYEIQTKLYPISINFPISAVKDLIAFSNTMTEIELDIKMLSEDNVCAKLLGLVDDKEKTPNIIVEVNSLAFQLVDLERKGWNGIWSRIITNYLSTASIGKFDVVVGNPPWVDWKNLPSNYRERIKSLCVSRKLFSGDGVTGGINLNICGLISNVAAENWMSSEGIMGLLMPETLLFQRSYEGYRNFYIGKNERMYFNKITDWTKSGNPFSPVQQKFLTYFISSKRQQYDKGIEVEVHSIKRGKKCYEHEFLAMEDFFDTTTSLVAQCNPKATTFTYVDSRQEAVEFSEVAGESYYKGREGVEVYPQELLVFTTVDNMQQTDTCVTVENIQNPKSKFKIAQQMQFLEKKYLAPLVKGVDISRFAIKESNYIVPFPYDEAYSSKIAIPLSELQKDSPRLSKYFLDNKSVLQSQNAYNDRIINNQNASFYSLARVGKYTFADYFVAYRDNSKWGACVVSKIAMPWGELKRPIFQNHAPYISQDEDGNYITEDEAHYICAILNSSIATKYISKSSDSRSYHIRPKIKIPKFDNQNKLHLELVQLSKSAHEIAKEKNGSLNKIDVKINECYLKLLRQ